MISAQLSIHGNGKAKSGLLLPFPILLPISVKFLAKDGFGRNDHYQSDEGVKLDVRLENKTVWLNIEQIAQLFNKGRATISEHISNIFKEGELNEKVVCRKFRQTTQHDALEGKTQSKEVKYCNLDVIISVGYRVKSIQGTRFRLWV